MKLKFDVTGMTCAACSARVEKVTAAVNGVEKVEVNLLAGSMTVEAREESIHTAIETAVKNAGYGASLAGQKKKSEAPQDDARKQMKKRIIGSAVFLVILMYFTMGHMVGLPMPSWYHGVENAMTAALLQLFLTLPVLYLNRSYYSRGLKALWHRAPNMDSLIAVGSGAAMVYGVAVLFLMANAMGRGNWDAVIEYSGDLYFESAAMILTLVTLGKFLETRAKGRTGDAIRQLMDLRPGRKANGDSGRGSPCWGYGHRPFRRLHPGGWRDPQRQCLGRSERSDRREHPCGKNGWRYSGGGHHQSLRLLGIPRG